MSSKVRKLISIATIFSMCLTPIYGYTGDATHYGMENHVVVQPPVVGAVLKSLGDNQFCISSTIGNPDLVPSIFTEPGKSHEKEITNIINAFSSMGVPFCTNEQKKFMEEKVQYVNTSLVDSEVYSNQKRITLVDRISGVVNNDIKIKTGGLMTAWPFELFHFQVPSFTSTTYEEMAVSMETAIETVQGVYTRVFSNSNEESPPTKKKFNMSTLSMSDHLKMCGWAALIGVVVFGVANYGFSANDDMTNAIRLIFFVASIGSIVVLAANVNPVLSPTSIFCWTGSGFLTYVLTE